MLPRITIMLMLCLSLAGSALGAAEPLRLTPQNTAIVNRSPYAGIWLQYYLKAMIAADTDAPAYRGTNDQAPDRSATAHFPLVDAPDAANRPHRLIVGDTRTLAGLLPADDLRRLQEQTGSVLLRRIGDDVFIAVASADPWYFAHIIEFLDRLAGVRVYAPSASDLWTSRPESKEITVPAESNLLIRPVFLKGELSGKFLERNLEWLRMTAPVSGGNPMRASHTITRYFDPAVIGQTHPDLFPMDAAGQRPVPHGQWNPCLADPARAAAVAIETVRRIMKEEPDTQYQSLAIMDTEYACRCETCQASLRAHDGDAATLWYDFLNRVAKQTRDEFPQLFLTSYAYANVGVPVGMKLESNIVIDYVTRSFQWADPERLEQQKRDLQQINRTGAGWVNHDWDFSGVTPRLYNKHWAEFLTWGRQHGMLGALAEWSPGEQWYIDGAKYYILRRVMSDPSHDVEALWQQYCRDMFGPAAEEMRAFYRMFETKHLQADQFYERDDLPRREMAGFTPQDLAQQRSLLEEAIRKTAGDPLISQRLVAVMRYFRGHELWALAVGEPARAYHRHTFLRKDPGINKEALAFYVNDDGSTLLEAIRYYDEERTIPPDSHEQNTALGMELSYRANYARALGTILQAVRQQAMQGVELSAATEQTVEGIVDRAVEIYRAALPEQYEAKRAAEIEALFRKIIWIPRVEQMPSIDGTLEAAEWAEGTDLADFTLADLLLPSHAGNVASGKIMRVGDHLVIGLRCEQPGGVWAVTQPDVTAETSIYRESCAEIFFGPLPEPGQESAPYAQYVVNALGGFHAYGTALDLRDGVRCAGKRDADGRGYTFEIAFPLKVEGRYDYSKPGPYTFTIMRQVYHADTFAPAERLGWHPLFYTAQKPESRGLVFLE